MLPSWLSPGGRAAAPHAGAETSRTFAGGSSILGSKSTEAGGVHVIDLAFDVVQVDLPLGGVRHSRKIWNHVDELRGGVDTASRLARNGLRIGVASPEAWPAIRAVLDAAGADVRRELLVAQPGVPLMIKLASVGESESIFSYGLDGRLVGKTFPGGDKLLNLDYVFHPELGGCTEIKLAFEVRRDRGVMAWERQGGIIRHMPAVDEHVFEDLNTILMLNTDEFLVIGLSDQAKNEYLVGGRFLISNGSAKRTERLLCVTPQPYSTQRAARRPP